MSLYLDASAIVPTLIEEGGTESVDRFLASATEPLVVSDLAATEVASALSRLVRTKLLHRDEANSLLDEFDAWRATATVEIDFQPSDFRLARLFVRNFDLALRAPDALHAAICRRADHQLVTLDGRLARAAEAFGVTVHNLLNLP